MVKAAGVQKTPAALTKRCKLPQKHMVVNSCELAQYRIGKWASYEIAKPVISATDTAGEPLPSTIEEGTPFRITATSTDDFVSFELYDNGEKVANAVYENEHLPFQTLQQANIHTL